MHEVYLKLIDQRRIRAENRPHFLSIASRAMRHILCDYGRQKRARKRGGGLEKRSLDDEALLPAETQAWAAEPAELLVRLDEALHAFEQVDPRRSRVVECRFFGGLTTEETALALDVSPRTVKRDWAVAQAWLRRYLEAPA